nr:MAG TPA: hypothetical protein [Caudoviricetes sp.]
MYFFYINHLLFIKFWESIIRICLRRFVIFIISITIVIFLTHFIFINHRKEVIIY